MSLQQKLKHELRALGVAGLFFSGALFTFNALSVVRRHFGEGGLRRLFLQPLPTTTSDGLRASEAGERQ